MGAAWGSINEERINTAWVVSGLVVNIHFSRSVGKELSGTRYDIYNTARRWLALMTDWKEMRTRNTACTCGAELLTILDNREVGRF